MNKKIALACGECGKINLSRHPLEEVVVKIFKFFKDVNREMRKVSFPKRKELVNYTITVIATVAFVAVFFTIIDLLITQVLNRL